MAEIKTRILLRNDTLANWEAANSVTLKKGEVGIAMLDGALAELRVGNNTTWANSKKLRVEAGQISGLIDTINTQINSLAYEYQLTAGTGDDLNKWFLQSRHLSGGDWVTVNTVDLTQLTGYALSTDVDALVAAVSAETLTSANAYTDTTVNAVSTTLSTDYVGKIGDLETAVNTLVSEVSVATYTSALADAKTYTDEAVDALSIDNYMLTADFSALSNEIGLSAANASNKVVTFDDIKDLAGAMHFRGAVTPNAGETDLEALARVITDPASGDVAIITTTSKEYVYNGTAWIELGDEVLYATKAEVATVSAELTSDIADLTADVDYLSGAIDDAVEALSDALSDVSATLSTDYVEKIGDLSTATDTLVATVSAETLVSANAYTDEQIAALSIGDYALSADVDSLVNATSVALSTDYVEKIGDLETSMTTLVGEVSAATYTSATTDANAYTDDAITDISATISTDYIKHGEVTSDDLSGYFVLNCGTASYRDGEQAATEA